MNLNGLAISLIALERRMWIQSSMTCLLEEIFWFCWPLFSSPQSVSRGRFMTPQHYHTWSFGCLLFCLSKIDGKFLEPNQSTMKAQISSHIVSESPKLCSDYLRVKLEFENKWELKSAMNRLSCVDSRFSWAISSCRGRCRRVAWFMSRVVEDMRKFDTM